MTELTIIPASGAALPAEPFTARHLIDGAWVDSADGATSERQSPAHGVTVSVAAKGGQAETEAAIAAARRVFDAGDWSRASGKDRATILLKVADLIERDLERIALIETLESGKPISQARARSQARRTSGAMPRLWPARCMATATTRLAPTCSGSS
jgi:betaine-aldehyde dehydrogenase